MEFSVARPRPVIFQTNLNQVPVNGSESSHGGGRSPRLGAVTRLASTLHGHPVSWPWVASRASSHRVARRTSVPRGTPTRRVGRALRSLAGHRLTSSDYIPGARTLSEARRKHGNGTGGRLALSPKAEDRQTAGNGSLMSPSHGAHAPCLRRGTGAFQKVLRPEVKPVHEMKAYMIQCLRPGSRRHRPCLFFPAERKNTNKNVFR